MSFSHIQGQLAALGSITNGKLIVIDQTFSGSLELATLLEDAFGEKELTLKGHFLESTDTSFRITGYTSVLQHTDWEFDLRVADTGGGYSFILKLLLPAGWKFADSFPELPLLDMEEEGGAECIVDTFQFSASWLVFSNVYAYDETLAFDLVQGLSFKGQALFRGRSNFYLGLLGLDQPLAMYGPVKEFVFPADPERFMGIRLHVDLPLAGDFGAVSVQRSGFLLRSPLRGADLGFYGSQLAGPGLFFSADLELGGRPLSLLANYDPDYSASLTFRGVFTDFNISGLSSLDATIGGGGLDGSVPAELGSLSGIAITEFGFTFDLGSSKVSSLSVGIGCANTWTLVEDWLTLSEIGLRFDISHPFNSSKRAIGVSVQGLATIQQTSFAVEMRYPGLAFRIQKVDENPLSLTGLISHFTDSLGDLPAVNVDRFQLTGDARRKQLALGLGLSELVAAPVGATYLRLDQAVFHANLQKGGGQTAFLRTELSLGSMQASLFANMGPGAMLSGTFANISLHTLYSELSGNTDVPDEVPPVTFDYINILYDIKRGDANFYASAAIAYDKLPFGSAIAANVVLNLNQTYNETSKRFDYSLLLQVAGTGPLSFADGFSLNEFSLTFEYGSATGWKVVGDFKTLLCDQPVNLTAAYISSEGLRKLVFSAIAPQPITLIGYEDLFSLAWSRLDLSIAKVDPEGGQARKDWALRLDALLRIPDIANVGGALEIFSDGQGKKGLKFKPGGLDTFHFDIADGIGINFLPKEVAVLKDSADASWKLVGSAFFGITGIPGSLGRAMPEKFIAELSLGKTATKLELISPLAPLDFPLPNADGKSLGKFVFEVRKIGIALRPTVGLSAQLGLGFPKELDDYFGGDIFRVYKAGDPLSMCLIDTTVSGTGIDLKFVTTPFLSGNTSKIQGQDWMHFDFGEYGQIGMLMPSFKYNMGSQYFEAGGGFKIEKPLFLPLSPVHNFLDAVGLGAAKAIFPDKLPIKGFSLVDENDNLKTEELIDFLGDIPADVKTTLRGVGDLLNRLPDDFKSYLRLEIPTELTFKFGFAPSGRVSLALHAPNEPIRFLYPGMVQGLVPMPGLIGIELHKLGIGTLASGSLFFGEIDAVIDMYDMPALVASLALPTNPGFPLPTSDELRRRIILRDVWALVPLSQGVPVPVPVFYDELGFEYKGLEGIGLQLHLGVPQPDFAAGGTALVSAIGNFLKTRNARLDPNTPPGGQDLRFRFHDEYLEAPEYLGGGKIGTVGKVIEVGTWKYVAQMLNFTKHFLLSDLIAAIPVENRMLNTTQKLAFFSFEATALLSTPEEFDGGAYTQLKLSAAQAADFRTVLPGVQTGATGAGNGSTGLIAFLRGAVKVSIFELTASLGIAGSDSMGFGTGFKLAGKVGGFIDAELSGALLLNAPKLEDQPMSYPAAQQLAVPAIPAPYEALSQYKALRFDSGSTKLTIPSSSTLHLPQFTYELWIKPSTPTRTANPFLIKEGMNFVVDYLKSGAIRFRFKTGTDTWFNCIAPDGTMSFGKWNHIALVKSKTHCMVYVNGVIKASGSPVGPVLTEPGALVCGPILGEAHLLLSEMRIWKYPRTAEEIKAASRVRLDSTERNLVAYYRFDIPNGTVARDLCGSHSGTITTTANSAVNYVDADLAMYEGLRMGGAGIIMSACAALASANCTVSATIRVPSTLHTSRPTAIFNSLSKRAHFQISSSNIQYIPRETFFTVTQVINGNNRKTYINDQLIVDGSIGSTSNAKEGLYLGWESGGNDPFSFSGELAEVVVWDSSQNDAWVKANYNAYWTGREAGMQVLLRPATVKDGRIYSLAPGGVVGSTDLGKTVVPFRPKGFTFSSSLQYGSFPKTALLSSASYTVEFWFRPDSLPTNGDTAFLYRSDTQNPRIAWMTGSRISHRWVDGGGTLRTLETASFTFELGTWYHIACTNDGKVARVFINGVKNVERTYTATGRTGSSNITIGRREKSSTREHFLGAIDELRVWSVVRTGTDILRDMSILLKGTEANLLGYYPLHDQDGSQLRDYGPNACHGTLEGTSLPEPMPSTPLASSSERMAIQALGHAHLRIGGHEVMVADMRMNDEEFWFKGKVSLFPDSWGIKVAGDAEVLIRKDKLYLSANTEVNLFGLQLLRSKALITHERAVLSGRFLGLETLLDIAWTGDNPHFTGSAALRVQRSLGLGAIYIKGIKVCDNYTLDLDVDIHFNFDFDKNGFACDARCKFKIEGVGFDVGFALKVPPVEVDEIVTMLKQELIDKAADYLAHVFGSALAYIENVANDAIEWTTDTYDDFVDALTEGYQQTVQDLANVGTQIGASTVWMVEVMADGFGSTLNEVGSALNTAGQEVGAIANGLVQGAEATFDDVGNVLESLGKTPEQIAGALQTAGATLQHVTDTLQNIGSTVEQIGSAITSIGAATDQLGTLLKNAGFNHKDISKAMNALGKSVQDIANSLKKALFDEKAIAEGLFYIGKGGDQVAAALKYVGYGIDQVSQAFKDLGKDAETLMRSLKHAFGTQWQTFTNRLKALDYPLSHITRALDNWCSDREIAGYLKGAGVGLFDICTLMKNTLGAGYTACYDILIAIGYSVTEVLNVMGRVY